MQSFAWSNVSSWTPKTSIPFVVDLNESTFKLLDQLLEIICENSKQTVNSSPISRDKEIIAVSTLNLLHLQVSPSSFEKNWSLLKKTKVFFSAPLHYYERHRS